jgi:hypothetical protein
MLVTLRDAGAYIKKLPKREHDGQNGRRQSEISRARPPYMARGVSSPGSRS